ncbi:Rib/alpha-like domain-containing protein [Gardnerella vaginalis]|uniref:Uncharacterized protein n=1 Tax=Gardnerella vaginalis TaxID=2702 RepID=A0A2K1SW19_GARVA|nr:Rib/alpha-like domain-containing protein [Gardnerella vaginalis]PNS43743.1 hypothetical protein BFS05_00480 [Gardnerella vaginalis]
MLPAKFRGFASRVGRLASRALAWNKTSERDGALNATSSTASATSNSDASAYRPSHTLRTFRRALFAMLVAAATLFATFVVPPVKEANATQAWWDYAGNGYFTDGDYWVGDAVRDVSISYPNIQYNQWDSDYGKSGTKISWDITFNANGMGLNSLSFNVPPKGNAKSDGSPWDGRPDLTVFLPKGLRDGDASHQSSVRVTRTAIKRKFVYNEKEKKGHWEFEREVKYNSQRPSEFTNSTKHNYTYADGDYYFNEAWKYSLGREKLGKSDDATCGDPEIRKKYGFCEIRKWRGNPNNSNDPSNKFGRVFLDWAQGDTTFSYEWHIEAFVEDGVNPETLPIIAGWDSNKTGVGAGYWGNSERNKWAAMGPFDTDGDGIPDYVEHQVRMNPTNGDEISYPQYNSSDDKKYGQDNIPITTYHRPVTVKPFARTGEWGGDSSHGSFEYDGGTTTNLPTNLGIKYELTNKIPNGVKVVSSPSKMPEGSVYIDSRTGHVTYNPRKEDKGKVLEFGTKITYPDPSRYPYNCKYYDRGSFVTEQHPTKIKVVSQASLYNPVYTPIDLTEKTGDNQRYVTPIVYTVKPQSVKDASKKHSDIIQSGDLPEDATFELKQYVNGNNRSDPVLDWSRIENQDKNNGKVRFYSNKWREPVKKYITPVVVHYADGSSSTDGDAGNADKNGDFAKSVVYASVNLKRPNPKDSELKLNIHNGYAGSNLGDNGSVTITVKDPLKPSIWIDSWAQYQIGQISLKSLCWKETTQKSGKVEKSDYTFSDLSKTNNDNTINGLTFKQTEKWPHADDKEQESCFTNGTCNNSKLYDGDAFTIERSRGEISGTPNKGGKYVCRVFALRDGSQAKTDFDNAAKAKKHDFSLNDNTRKYDWQSKTVTFVAHSLAHKYNPQYIKVNVKAGHKGGVTSAAPVSQRGANGVKDDDKSQNDLVPNGTRLPKGTWFELKKYSKHTDSKDKLSWSSFEGKQSNKKSDEDKPEDSTSDEMYGKVTFAPNNGILTGKYNTPVIVHYPDGSTSEDPDSGNLGKPVYAPVEVTDQDIQDDDLKLKVYSQYGGGRQIADNDKNGMRFRKGDTLGDKSDDTYKPMFFDSWSSAKPGKIYQRMLCYKLGADNKRSGYKIGGINGLTLAGRKDNTTNGDFTDQPSQWTRANEKQKNECNKNKNNCKPNLYLYGDEHDTVERTWGWLHGKVEENGDFVCTVYAIKDLENKDGKHGDLQKKFDKAVKSFVDNPGNRKLEDVVNGVLTNKKNKDKPLEATQRHVDWDSVTFPIHVHSDAHYYNPKYEEVKKLQAGETGTSNLPKSFKNANGAKNNQDDVKNNESLPDGTWFEFKQYTKDKKPNGAEPLNYAFFENDDDNVKNEGGKKLAKNGTGQFGNVTFHPHRWVNANRSDNAPVIVHYPDGSTSEDPDSGNNGNPVYAKVNVVPHDYNPGDLSFDVTNNFNNGGWADKTIKIKKGDPLTNSHPRRLNLWSTHKPGKIELRTICHKIIHKDNTADTTSEYTWNGIAGITMENPIIWDHQEDPQKQHQCYGDKKQCDAKLLYDDYVINGNSRNTTERTRASLVGKANESGDYECVVYAIKQGSKLLDSFDKAIKSIKPDKSGKVTPSDTDPLKNFKWKLDGDTGKKDAVKGVDYEYRSIPIHIHNDNHFYNPKYVDVSVTAGQKVENAVPQSVKSANGADKYQDAVKAGALPDGTWFEFKDAANGFEVNADGTKGNSVSLDWSYWASGNATDKTGEQSNKPDNPSKQKNGKHSSKDDGTRYGKVTFHPDQSVAPKAYLKEIVIHYPDGSNSDDPDSGNNGKPVYAKVTVAGFSGADKDLKMTLLRSQDADPVDTLGGGNSLTVMSGTSLTKNPYVRAWSLKDRSNISLRMMCTKQGEQKWSHGLDDTLNMHLNQDYGESVKPWAFATADQRKSCSENGDKCIANLLYGFTKNGKQDSIESAVSRSEDDIAGVPQKAGKYTCAVFALKPNALTVFNGLSSSIDMKKVQLTGLKSAVDWNRISFDVNVIDPPKFALPKTGGDGMNMALLVLMIIGMCVMCGAFFVDQTKWGHAMLDALLRKTLLKDFICKTAKKLRALRRLGERWRC